MDEPTGRIAELIRSLDSIPIPPTLIQITNALKRSKLQLTDVEAYVKETNQSYHRSLVVRRENYELLVLTWRPGQESLPHDHSGSISAMLVLNGQATERFWRIAPDSYADLEFEAVVPSGELTAWQDAGVHSIGNASSEQTLVTVHVYAPTLRDFRRFNARPEAVKAEPSMSNNQPTVVIVGGGFSGAATAAQLLRRSNLARFPLNVILVERQGAIGEGVAYGTHDPLHLLNVPSGRMSAWPDAPDDFANWIASRYGVHDRAAFVRRKWYGEYVRETLLKAAHEVGGTAKLTVLFDEVRRISRRPDKGWLVSYAKSVSTTCNAVVLAIGHRSPTDPIGRNWAGPRVRYISDPWLPFVTNAIAAHDPVVILGSGLTAVDTVLSLSHTPRTAPIWLLSRRGLMPQMHSGVPAPAFNFESLMAEWTSKPLRINDLLKAIRKQIKSIVASGGDWRTAIDGLRPHTSKIWQSLSFADRRRFLTHLRPFWEIHRHRTAVDVANRFRDLIAKGLVKVIAGRVSAAQSDEKGVRLFVRERGEERSLEINAGWVMNCTGPSASNSAESNPVIGSLLVHDWAAADPLSLGLESNSEGNVLDAKGDPTPNLFVVGTLRKPNLWESTAVPELRVQAGNVAESILTQFSPELSSSVGSSWSI